MTYIYDGSIKKVRKIRTFDLWQTYWYNNDTKQWITGKILTQREYENERKIDRRTALKLMNEKLKQGVPV